MSLKSKLVDALGGEEVAKDWLVDEKGLSKDLKLVTREPARPRDGFLFSNAASRWVLTQFGVPTQAQPDLSDIVNSTGTGGLFLDGLLSLWQPAG